MRYHGPAHRGANGAVMPTDDEEDQDGHFFFNHPERGGLLRCLGAQPLLLLFKSSEIQRGFYNHPERGAYPAA